jgi:hypothetical protein
MSGPRALRSRKSKEQQQRNPEAARQLAKGRALIGGEERVAGKERRATGQRGCAVRERSRASARVARPVPASSRNVSATGTNVQGSPGPAPRPTSRSAADKRRSAARPRRSWRSRPMRIGNPVPPTVQARRTRRPDGSRSRARRSCRAAVAAQWPRPPPAG